MRSLQGPTVLEVRHGSTKFNAATDDESRIKGTRFDLPLTPEGHEEAKRAAKIIAQFPVASIRSSAMLRARQTAEHISKATGIPVQIDKKLDPLDAGYLSGMTRESAKRRLEFYINHPLSRIPEGDKYGDWFDRATDATADEMGKAERAPDKARVIVVHSCNAKANDAMVSGEEPRFHGESGERPAQVRAIQKRGGRWGIHAVDEDGRTA